MQPLPTFINGGTRVTDLSPANDDAPTVVLVHGMGGTLDFWTAIAPPLARSNRVIAFDVPGFGISVAPPVYSLETVARDVGNLLDRLDVKDATVIGHSLGCLLVLQMAVQRPDIVGRLILIDPVLFSVERLLTHPVASIRHPVMTLRLAALFVGAGLPSTVGTFIARHDSLKRTLLRGFFVSPQDVSSDLLKIAFSHLGGRSARYILKVVPAARLVGVRNLLSRAAQPLSLIYGSRDPFLPVGDIEELKTVAKLSDEHRIAGAGHAPIIEKPAETILAINAILTGRNTSQP